MLSSLASAQAKVAWNAFYDGNLFADEVTFVATAAPAPGGGLVALCRTDDTLHHLPRRFAVVRWSSSGQQLWNLVLPSYPLGPSIVRDIAVDAQGTSYVLGLVLTNGIYSTEVFAIDSTGAVRWTQSIPNVLGVDIAVAPSGDVVLAGCTYAPLYMSDIFVSELLPATGAVAWTTTVSSTGDDQGGGLKFDSAGSVFLMATFHATGLNGRKLGTLKLSATGQLLWVRKVESPISGQAGGAVAAVAPGGNVVVGGFLETSDYPAPQESVMYVSRMDTNGVARWRKTYMIPPSSFTTLMDLEVAADGSTWALASGNSALALLHYDVDGSVLSETLVDPPGSAAIGSRCMKLGAAGQVWVGALWKPNYSSPVAAKVLQFDHTGALDWDQRFASSAPEVQFHSYGACRFAEGKQMVFVGASGKTPIGMALAIDLNAAPDAYCTAKTNSLGCAPALEFTGSPSAAASSGFVVSCSRMVNQTRALLLYSVTGPAAVPFRGGTLCVAAPVLRSPTLGNGGSASPTHDCTGSYTLEVNAFAQGLSGGAPSPALRIPGTRVWMQCFGSDPGLPAPDGTSLSNALTYVVLP